MATRRYSAESLTDGAVGRLRVDVDASRAGGRAGHLRPGQDLDALPLEGLFELGRHGLVFDRHQPRQQLDNRDLAAEPAEDGRELDADRAAPQDDDRLRNVLQPDRFVTRDDPFAVDGDPGDAPRLRAGRDDDLARRGEDLRLAVGDFDPALARQAAAALDPIDLVLLEEKLDPAGQALDDLVFPRLHLTHVDADCGLTDGQPPVLPVLGDLERVGVFEERLGRDAAPVETSAAERRCALDHGGSQPQLGGTNGGHVAAGP